MSKVTSKLQLTLPKALAVQYRIRPGDTVSWVALGESLRLVPGAPAELEPSARLASFDAATARLRARRCAQGNEPRRPGKARGWTREELYDRGRAR
jgi:bifunctional DNA-binding transcriptional regulator/antitoxin component of YhaV-PrlF toxin-antitoxin module